MVYKLYNGNAWLPIYFAIFSPFDIPVDFVFKRWFQIGEKIYHVVMLPLQSNLEPTTLLWMTDHEKPKKITEQKYHLFGNSLYNYLCCIEYTFAIIRASDGKLSVVTEVGGRNKAVLGFIPHSDFLLRNVPQPQLTVQWPTEEVPVILNTETQNSTSHP